MLSSPTTVSNDRVIQGTDEDASVSRLSAVSLGYLGDPYAEHFVDGSSGSLPRRLPIINRGRCFFPRVLEIKP